MEEHFPQHAWNKSAKPHKQPAASANKDLSVNSSVPYFPVRKAGAPIRIVKNEIRNSIRYKVVIRRSL